MFLQNLGHFGFGPDVMKQMKVCRHCGKTMSSEKRYCDACGVILPAETLYDLYKAKHICCPDCDTVVSDSSLYCPECGRLLHRRKNSEI